MRGRAGDRFRRRFRSAWFVLLALLAAQTLASATSTWVAGVRIPKGYRVVAKHHPGTGVWHLVLTRHHPDEVLHVAVVERGSPNRLRVLLSNGHVSGPSPRTERTSSMCRHVHCLLAVNGDFFTDAGAPVGGVVADGEPLRSPLPERRQFTAGPDGRTSLGALQMATTLVTVHQRVPTGPSLLRRAGPPEARTTVVDGVNVGREADQIVLYTPRFGTTTEARGGSELVGRIVAPAGPLRTGVDTTIELVSAHSGGSRIPSDGVVLSGSGDGASKLASLWHDVQAGVAQRGATLRVRVSPNAQQSVAGKPVLVRDGDRVTSSRSSRAPRTMIGWNADGSVLLVTADGRQPGRADGLTVIEAADLMRALGAVEAMNLDGGGSTTFVLRGDVVNRPSNDGSRERSVAVAVAVVPA
jgi:hypothetical protein